MLKKQEHILDNKIVLECGTEIFCYNSYDESISIDKMLELVSITKTETEKLGTLIICTNDITKIQTQIHNLSHIISLCESIIFNVWKRHYSQNKINEIFRFGYKSFYNRL